MSDSLTSLDFTKRADLKTLTKGLRNGWDIPSEIRTRARQSADRLLADPDSRRDLRDIAARLLVVLDQKEARAVAGSN